MKASSKKVLLLDTILLIILLFNSFISSILNYNSMVLLLILFLIAFKFILGFEKDRHRYIRDIAINIVIILLVYFIVYYLSGLFIGFVRTSDQLSLNGIFKFVIPYIIMICLREYLRYQIIQKCSKSKWLWVYTCLVFIVLDCVLNFKLASISSKYDMFMFVATRLFPAISTNITACYIASTTGFKANILWIVVMNIYEVILPYIPNTGLYIGSMIKLIFPLCILYSVHSFYRKRKPDVPDSEYKKMSILPIPILVSFIFVIVYFTSGYFRYYTVAIATGSMIPNIEIGDVAIVDQKFTLDDLKIGQVIACKVEGKTVVHRLVQIDRDGDDYFFYTKGDANNAMDSYIVYYDMIVGIVEYKVPYIGLPTIWLNEL